MIFMIVIVYDYIKIFLWKLLLISKLIFELLMLLGILFLENNLFFCRVGFINL